MRHGQNSQGRIWSDEAPAGKRLYDVPGICSDDCPISLLLSKTDSNATNLFNSCIKEVLTYAESLVTLFNYMINTIGRLPSLR